jgi:hypothetical protein
VESLVVLTAAHLHLLLHHVPTLGAVIGLGLLLLAFVRRHDGLQQAGLEVLFVVALLTLPVYVTGVAAYKRLPMGPEVTDVAIRAHQDAALAGFTIAQFAGLIAWFALWQARRRGRAPSTLVAAATIVSIVALAVMARAATLGGEIHHSEIRAAAVGATAVDPQQFVASQISRFMVYSRWAWPLAETVHFLGLSLSFGVLLAVNLRILGVMRQVPFANLHQWLPWGLLGFGANLLTGMLFFVGQPGQYVESSPFIWKIVFLMIAGANFLYLTVFKKAWAVDGLEAPLADKAMAVGSMVSWLAVLYAGRMLPFIGNAF